MMSPRRLYLDNAATSFPKPPAVAEAMGRYATELGASAGRGAYAEAMETGAAIATCRRRINELFHGENPDHVIFTLNCTDALNLAIHGLIDPAGGDQHAICTQMDHNSILRPLNALQDAGAITQSRVPVDPVTGLVDPDAIRRAITPQTKLIAITHVSNVTGTIQPIRAIGRIAREHGIPLVVDAAQSAGHLPIDVRADGIDLLAAPGHKSLMGPLGTGFLYIRPGLEKQLRTIRQGGTGSVSEVDRQPEFLPDKYEAGSHNAIGLVGLSAGVAWVAEQTVEKLAAHDRTLLATFLEGLDYIEGLTYFGPRGVKDRIGLFSVTLDGFDPQELSAVLESSFGILTRSGIHCAPLAHAAIGTLGRGGTTRFSFGPFLSLPDVQFATDALAEVALSRVAGLPDLPGWAGEATCPNRSPVALPARFAYTAGVQYTLRNISKPLDRSLRTKAKSEGKSLNALAIELIERGLGLAGELVVHHDMDDLFGSGALEPAVLKAIREQDVVNPDDWR